MLPFHPHRPSGLVPSSIFNSDNVPDGFWSRAGAWQCPRATGSLVLSSAWHQGSSCSLLVPVKLSPNPESSPAQEHPGLALGGFV